MPLVKCQPWAHMSCMVCLGETQALMLLPQARIVSFKLNRPGAWLSAA